MWGIPAWRAQSISELAGALLRDIIATARRLLPGKMASDVFAVPLLVGMAAQACARVPLPTLPSAAATRYARDGSTPAWLSARGLNRDPSTVPLTAYDALAAITVRPHAGRFVGASSVRANVVWAHDEGDRAATSALGQRGMGGFARGGEDGLAATPHYHEAAVAESDIYSPATASESLLLGEMDTGGAAAVLAMSSETVVEAPDAAGDDVPDRRPAVGARTNPKELLASAAAEQGGTTGGGTFRGALLRRNSTTDLRGGERHRRMSAGSPIAGGGQTGWRRSSTARSNSNRRLSLEMQRRGSFKGLLGPVIAAPAAPIADDAMRLDHCGLSVGGHVLVGYGDAMIPGTRRYGVSVIQTDAVAGRGTHASAVLNGHALTALQGEPRVGLEG